MRHYVIASHKHLAEGFYSAVKAIVGTVENVHVINAYITDQDLDDMIMDCFNNIPNDAEVIVFSDIYGGSVNTRLMNYMGKHHFHLVAGVNLALIISIMVESTEPITKQAIREKIEACRHSMKYCNDDFETEHYDEEDF